MKHFYTFLAVLGFVLVGCEQDEAPVIKTQAAYFALKAGAYQVYNINETIYSEVRDPEIHAYQLMVQLVDSFPNADNNYTYVLSRMKRTSAEDDWQNLDTWSVRVTERELIVNEGNIPFVKVMTPPTMLLTWNGNKFNNEGDDMYEITAVDEPVAVNGTTFDKTVTVTQENNEDFIVFLDQRKEIYAQNIGLVLKELTQLKYCTQDQCLGQQIIESGRIFKQELIGYGNQ